MVKYNKKCLCIVECVKNRYIDGCFCSFSAEMLVITLVHLSGMKLLVFL